jgi:putative transposase
MCKETQPGEVLKETLGEQFKGTAKLRVHQARRRLDFTHKLTTDLAKNHGYVGAEDLWVKDMTASAEGTVENPGTNVAATAGLNRAILDNTPGERGRRLDYKYSWYGSVPVPVRVPGTSQTCVKCETRDPRNRPGCGRIFACVTSGYQAHADENAAEVTDLRARTIIAGGYPVNSTGIRKPSPGRKARGASGNHPQTVAQQNRVRHDAPRLCRESEVSGVQHREDVNVLYTKFTADMT